MIDTASIVFSLVAVMWILVHAVTLDKLRPWYDRLVARTAPKKQ